MKKSEMELFGKTFYECIPSLIKIGFIIGLVAGVVLLINY
jgi:hypothetical protein